MLQRSLDVYNGPTWRWPSEVGQTLLEVVDENATGERENGIIITIIKIRREKWREAQGERKKT